MTPGVSFPCSTKPGLWLLSLGLYNLFSLNPAIMLLGWLLMTLFHFGRDESCLCICQAARNSKGGNEGREERSLCCRHFPTWIVLVPFCWHPIWMHLSPDKAKKKKKKKPWCRSPLFGHSVWGRSHKVQCLFKGSSAPATIRELQGLRRLAVSVD